MCDDQLTVLFSDISININFKKNLLLLFNQIIGGGNVEDASNDSDSKMKESDLLEGISEEELDVSDDEKDKVKVADALGVDWSQLITPKEVKENKVAGSFRKQWTPGAIFSRIGLPKRLLKPGQYDEIIEKLNEQGDEVEILHPVAFVHQYKKSQLEQQAEEAKVRYHI